MGPRTYGLNLLATKFFWCSTTLHFLLQNSLFVKTCQQNLCTIYVAFQDWLLAISHKRRFSSLSCVTIGISLVASLGGCPSTAQVVGTIGTCSSPFERGWIWLSNAPNYCSKTQPIPNGPPNFVITLTLGLRPRQGLARMRDKKEAREVHLIVSGVQESVREWTFTLPSEFPFWEL
jgi:hypothetical protein